jgi:hypothetical protein
MMLAPAAFSSLTDRAVLRREVETAFKPSGEKWDVSWVKKITGQHRAVFDATQIEDGNPLLRAMVWKRHNKEIYGHSPASMSAVLVFRHYGVALAMNQDFWTKYEIGKKHSVRHPFTEEPIAKNPILLSAEAGELPEGYESLNLDGFFKAGGIALACNLALDYCIATVTKADGVDADTARKTVLSMMLPGIVLQPSGVFATLRAQQAGCKYILAS